jgi:hypothetical protein
MSPDPKGEKAMNERGRGWIVFAVIVLGVAGVMRIFDSI